MDRKDARRLLDPRHATALLAGSILMAASPPAGAGDGLEREAIAGQVLEMAEFRGELVVAGRFSQIGDLPTQGIALLRGDQWVDLGGDLSIDREPSPDVIGREGNLQHVTALLPDPDGLYAGGFFSTIDGIAADNIARWDGSQWSPVGGGLAQPVRDLVRYEGDLYAATGLAHPSRGSTALWRLDPAGWVPVPLPAEFDIAYIRRLRVVRGALYCLGNFTGGEDDPSRPRWSPRPIIPFLKHDGQGWEAAASVALSRSRVPDERAILRSSVAGGHDLAEWRGDLYLSLEGEGVTGIHRVGSRELHQLPGAGFATTLLARPGGLLAIGPWWPQLDGEPMLHPVPAEWTGQAWRALAAPRHSARLALAAMEWRGQPLLAIAGSDLYDAPASWTTEGRTLTWLATPNGGDLAALRPHTTILGEVETLLPWGGQLIAAGRFSYAGRAAAYGVAGWNGKSWAPIGGGLVPASSPTTRLYRPGPDPDCWDGGYPYRAAPNGVLHLVRSGRELIAGGRFYAAGDTTIRNLARWDGQRWKAVEPRLATADCRWEAVEWLGEWSGGLAIKGWFVLPGETGFGGFANLGASGWSAVDLPVPPRGWSLVDQVADGTDLLVVFGDLGCRYPADCGYEVFRRDGSRWVSLGSSGGIWRGTALWEGRVVVSRVDDGIWVHGEGGWEKPANWQPDWPPDVPIEDRWFKIYPSGDRLFALGPVKDVGPGRMLWEWDGESWSAIPAPGLDKRLSSIAAYEDWLYTAREGWGTTPVRGILHRVPNPLAGSSPGLIELTPWVTPSHVLLDYVLEASTDSLALRVERRNADGALNVIFEGPVESPRGSITDRPLEGGFFEYTVTAWNPRVDLGEASVAFEWNPWLPTRDRLLPAYPNPFNPQTTLAFELRAPAMVRLEIFNSAGRRVRSLDLGQLGAGPHDTVWDGRDDGGASVASGSYLVRMSASGQVDEQRVLLLK